MPHADYRQLSAAFYARVDRDPVLRPFFPGKSMHCAIEELAAFLAQYFGGPSEDTQRRWWVSLRESHRRFKIGKRERDAWLKNMFATLGKSQNELRDFFEQTSAYIANLPSSAPPAVLQMDESVAAVRRGEVPPPVANRSVSVGLLSLMIHSRSDVLLAHVRERFTADPSLVNERYGGRTLLQEAAGAGELGIVELMLQLGANVNPPGHTPLYSVANECSHSNGAAIVRALVQAGGNVNSAEGAKRCTPLHMAARRGNLEIADALLDCGADIEARDNLGVTPLQRALNCRKPELAQLLRARGARDATR